jgi:hypothetical protein
VFFLGLIVVTDLASLFLSITDYVATNLIPAVLVAIGAVVVAGLILFGAKFGLRAVKSFFGIFAK